MNHHKHEVAQCHFDASLGLSWLQRAGREPTLLCIHGNSADGRTFERLLREPSIAIHAAVVPDLPGHGASVPSFTDGPDRYSIDDFARAIGRLLAALKLHDPLIVGHSLGGHIALRMLALGLLPSARGMVISGTPPMLSSESFATAFRPSPSLSGFLEAHPSAAMAEEMGREAFGPNTTTPAWANEALRRTDPEARAGVAMDLLKRPFPNELSFIEEAAFPVAVLHAADDAFISSQYVMALRCRNLWRGTPQLFADCGHYMPWENPTALSEVIVAMITDGAGR